MWQKMILVWAVIKNTIIIGRRKTKENYYKHPERVIGEAPQETDKRWKKNLFKMSNYAVVSKGYKPTT